MLKVPIGKMKTYILTLSLAAFFAAVARAELKWEQTQIELHPAIADKQAVAHLLLGFLRTYSRSRSVIHPGWFFLYST